jgi:hypothetical protein
MKKLFLSLAFFGSVLNAADLRLEWQDNSNNEDGFEIWRKTNNGEWLLIGATGPDVTTFNDGVIPIGVTLSYQVRAWNQFGESGFTNVVSIGTFPPAAPSNLKGAVVPSEPVSDIRPKIPQRGISIKTYRDDKGRLVIVRS